MVVDGGSWTGSDGSGVIGGSTAVTYATTGGKGTIVGVNTTDNTIMLTDTNDKDERWIAQKQSRH